MGGMKISAGGSGKVDPIGAGTVMARVLSVITLGEHQVHSQYPEKGSCDKVLLTVELPTETMKVDGEDMPRLLSQELNLYLNEKANLYKVISALDTGADLSSGYDLSDLVGKACMVTIGATVTGKDKIVGWTATMKGLDVPELANDSILFDFYDPNQEVYDKLMEWVKGELKDATNFSGSPLEKMLGDDTEGSAEAEEGGEELPF